jgi:hypothetical protein
MIVSHSSVDLLAPQKITLPGEANQIEKASDVLASHMPICTGIAFPSCSITVASTLTVKDAAVVTVVTKGVDPGAATRVSILVLRVTPFGLSISMSLGSKPSNSI